MLTNFFVEIHRIKSFPSALLSVPTSGNAVHAMVAQCQLPNTPAKLQSLSETRKIFLHQHPSIYCYGLRTLHNHRWTALPLGLVGPLIDCQACAHSKVWQESFSIRHVALRCLWLKRPRLLRPLSQWASLCKSLCSSDSDVHILRYILKSLCITSSWSWNIIGWADKNTVNNWFKVSLMHRWSNWSSRQSVFDIDFPTVCQCMWLTGGYVV